MKVNHNHSELAGIILGDGHMHTTANRITIVGGLQDLHFYTTRVIPLFQNEFNIAPTLRRRKDRNT